MINKRNLFKRIISILTVVTIIVPTFTQIAISAEEADKYPYNIFGRNGIEINAGNLCINGDVHTNKEANITAYGKNINGKITTGNDIEKRVKHVYADTKIHEKYFTENCELYEDGYVKSEMNIHINSPIFSYRNIELDGNVALNSNIGTLMNINVTGEVKNANTSVVYSKYGNITIENDSTANINGLIYAPLGTLTINSPNVSINGVIIADKIIINGNSINLNGNDNIARFIGTESEVYDFSYLVNLPESWFLDTDNDELFDFYEKAIDTDFLNSDTDGDMLPDGYEVLTLNTDPLEVDTDENGVSDADEDFDNDNLNNLSEYENKTEPFNPDTDDDGLLDGDEIKKYKTDPLNSDTDNDGLLDGDEIKLGFDPLNPQTFGILDSEYETKQDISSDSQVFSQINTEENPFNVSLQIDSTGCVESNITVEKSVFSEIIDNDSLIGIAPEFQCDDTCKISKAVLKFTIDSEKLESVSGIFSDIGELQGMKRFCIFKYFEDMNILLPVETLYDENSNTIYTETEELGTYCVMDMESWISSFGFDEEEQYNEEQYQYPDEAAPMSIEETPDKNELTETEKEQCSVKIFDSHIDEYSENEIESYSNAITANTTTTQQTPLDVVFIIEQAGTQKEAFERQKRAIQYASRNLCAMQEDVRIYIIGFNKNSAKFYKATSSNYLTNASQVNTALSKISYTITNDYCNRGTAFNLVLNNVQFRNYAARFAFLILNGATTVYYGYKSQLDFCAKRDVNYSEVMASGYNYNSNYDQQVKKASLKSNGIFIHDNQQLQFLIYGHIQRNIARPNTVFNISLPTSWNGINLKGALSPTNKVDSDSDGLTDWKEADIECGLIKWDNSGNIILPKFKDCISRASEKEAVHSAFLTYYKYMPRSINYILNASVLPIHSNPCSKDSDGDGIIDPNEYRNVTKDSRYDNLNPLLSDTIETLYPELKGKKSNNKKSNPIYLDVDDNTITLKVKYSLGGLAEQISNIKIPNTNIYYTHKQIIFSSISRKWNTTVNGNEFDFYPGMKINIRVEFEKKSFGQKYIKFNVVNCGDFTTSKWTTNCNKVITVGIKDKKGNFLPELNRFASPAHEFGHALGLTDIYGYGDKSDWRLQPVIYNINKRNQNEIWYNNSGNNFDGDLMYSFGKVRANDIEMVLQAYCENKKQYFRPEFDKNNYVSKAIKQNSNNIYLDRTNNNFVIYNPSTKKTTQIGDVTAYKSWLYDNCKINVSVDDLNNVYFG